jgi:hypothetical protein
MSTHPILAALLLGVAPGDLAESREAETPPEQFERVERRIRQWQPTAEERRFDEIGWASGVRDAIRLAKGHWRPVFLFTHDGHMNVGRC